MTLSGNSDRKEAWKARQEARTPRRSWVMPLIVGITVAVLVGALLWYWLFL
jgi:uncharacterized integral membrane protein